MDTTGQGSDKENREFHGSDEGRGQENRDVFDLFRPSLWNLRLAGVWLPGDLKTAPGMKESLRGGCRAMMYFLYCMVVTLTLWVHGIRLIPCAVTLHGDLGEKIMVIVMIIILLSSAVLHLRCHVRKPRIEFAEALNEYYRTYGGSEYVQNAKKSNTIMTYLLWVFSTILIIIFFLFFYVWFPNFKWINFPLKENTVTPIQIIWIISSGVPWFHGSLMGISHAIISHYLIDILNHEFSKLNMAVKNLTRDLLEENGTFSPKGSNTCNSTPDTNFKHGAGKRIQVAVAPRAQMFEETTVYKILHTNVIEMAEDIDDLRYRFEQLVDLMNKMNAAIKYEIVEIHIVFIPFFCLVVRGFVEAAHSTAYIIFMTLCGVGLLGKVSYYTFQAIKLNVQAHASSDYLQKPRFKHLSEKTIQLINVFLARLNGPPVGVTICGLITINASSTLALVGTLVAYIFVVMELGTGPFSCPAPSLPGLNTSVAAANWTGSQ